MSGDLKVIDRAFIEQLGQNIEDSGSRHLPGAKSDAATAADLMTSAGQGGGLLVVAAFFFATEYVQGAWETKKGTTETLNAGAKRIAKNWRSVEEGDGTPPRGMPA